MQHTPLTLAALDLATKGHAGQKRRDGQDYITHPIAVAALTVETFETEVLARWRSHRESELLYIIAILHDLAEDNKDYTVDSIVYHLRTFLTVTESKMVSKCLYALNSKNFSTYLDMIKAVLNEEFAVVVKKSDITHNLSQDPGKKKDLYLLALHILDS